MVKRAIIKDTSQITASVTITETTPRKRKRVVGKRRELAALYGLPKYKTPCVSNGVREALLGSASEHTLAYMLNYNPAQTEITRQGMIRDLQRIRDAYKRPPHITARS